MGSAETWMSQEDWERERVEQERYLAALPGYDEYIQWAAKWSERHSMVEKEE